MAREFKGYTREEFINFMKNVKVKRKITHIQIHHTWKPRKTDYVGVQTIEAIWRYHTQNQKWQDIAEHFTIAPDGTIWDGRSLELDPAGIVGHNQGGFMFEIIGDFDLGEETLEGEQLQSTITAVNTVKEKFNLTDKDIVFHREFAPKTCPGSGISKDWFVTILNEPLSAGLPFTDVPKNHYAYEAIKSLYDAGIMNGVDKNKFGLHEPLIREDAALIIYRLLEQLKSDKTSGNANSN